MNLKNIKKRIIIYMLVFVCVAILIETSILGYANRKQVNKTSHILLNQVENILRRNAQSEKDILESLKVEYVQRANTVAYMLKDNKVLQSNVEELTYIANLMGIDEIHLFDDKGVLYAGTVPKYYGLTLDAGEQVAYFMPMLEDKQLTMCQDVTPNTAESKSMMYAIVWDEAGEFMVQVGIEPVRLLEEMKQNSIYEVVRQMPVYEGMNIYVADIQTGEILGATEENTVGSTVFREGFLSENDDIENINEKTLNINGYKNYCYFRQHDQYIIATVHSTRTNVDSFVVSLSIEIIWLLLAGGVILYTLLKLANANNKINNQMSILSSISDIYYSMHLIDMKDYSIERLESNTRIDRVVESGNTASDMLNTIVNSAINYEYIDAVLEFVNLSNLGERLKNKNSIFMDAIDKNVGWLRISFIAVDTDENKIPTKVIIATQVIDDEKKREEELSFKANRDELTGLFNRRAYEDDILNYPDVPTEDNFVYAAIDINGLKVVNDEFGHAAGDELIRGAAECLKRSFGNYGKVYRTGGDEFVSMFFADEEHLQELLEELTVLTDLWKGSIDSSLSLSVGCGTKREFRTETVVEIASIADERMYKAKEEFYSKKGIDRKGQAAAHKALCNLYTKILKINLTEDSYSIVNMYSSEQTEEKGFSDKISEWLSNFGKSGQVHKDDLEGYLEKTNIEYLREYFKGNKTSVSISYRRKYDDIFKQVVMEMIPANDYSDENQSLFLYVKSIDR